MGNKFKYLPYTLGMLGVFLIIGLLSSNNQPDKVPYKQGEQSVTIDLDKNESFTPDNFKKEINKLGIKHSSIVYAQARLETGNFKSKYFINKNNLFGFRGNNGYMTFKSWQDCVDYYKRWQNKRYKGGDYYNFLINIRYAEDSLYISKLKSCIN